MNTDTNANEQSISNYITAATEDADSKEAETAPLLFTQRLDHRLTTTPTIANANPLNPPRPSTFLPQMIYRKASSHLTPSELLQTKRLDIKFGLDSKRLLFNRSTFWEEFIAHCSQAILGPFSVPIVLSLCGKTGAKITGFYPGTVAVPTDVILAQDDYQSNLTVWWIQITVWALQWVPIWVMLVAFSMGWIRTHPSLINGHNNNNNNNNTTTVPFLPNESWQYTDLMIADSVVLPIFCIFIRQYVIAVKYAFIPRNRLRAYREAGRHMRTWSNELLATWTYSPTPEAIALQVEKACWRAGIDAHAISLEFCTDISVRVQQQIIHNQENQDTGWVNMFDKDDVPSNSNVIPSMNDVSSNRGDLENNGLQPTQTLPLHTFLKMACFQGTMTCSKPKLFGIKEINAVLLICFVGAFISPVYRLYHGRLAFGNNSFDQWCGICQFINVFSPFGFAATLFVFPLCARVHFWRQRIINDHYFELLIPSTVPDARQIERANPSVLFSKLPDLKPTAANVYAWNMGRHAVRKYAMFYRIRMEYFLGLYVCMVSGLCLYEFINMIIKTAYNESVVLTAGLMMEGFFVVSLLFGLFLIILSGIRANRQTKLHKSAVAHYRTRLSAHINDQVLTREKAGVDPKEIKLLIKNEKALQKSLKLVANELDSEGASEKVRINGFPIDNRMLEGLVGLLGTIGITGWQILNNQ